MFNLKNLISNTNLPRNNYTFEVTALVQPGNWLYLNNTDTQSTTFSGKVVFGDFVYLDSAFADGTFPIYIATTSMTDGADAIGLYATIATGTIQFSWRVGTFVTTGTITATTTITCSQTFPVDDNYHNIAHFISLNSDFATSFLQFDGVNYGYTGGSQLDPSFIFPYTLLFVAGTPAGFKMAQSLAFFDGITATGVQNLLATRPLNVPIYTSPDQARLFLNEKLSLSVNCGTNTPGVMFDQAAGVDFNEFGSVSYAWTPELVQHL